MRAANGFIGLIFAAVGLVAAILALGTRGGLSQADLASWMATCSATAAACRFG